MMADEFNLLWSKIENYIAEADADLIPVQGQVELHGRCRCGVLLSPRFGALFVADLILGVEDLELHYRCRGRSNFRKIGIATISVSQDKFDHDKGQKSAISGRRLHWRLSIGFFAFSPVFMWQFSKTSPLKSGESSEKSSGENRVKSRHVCGCHGFFRPWVRMARSLKITEHPLITLHEFGC